MRTTPGRERQREAARVANTTHGMNGTKTYTAWVDMVGRCTNTDNANWDNYGGRGIGLCQEWKSFEAFFSDMGICPDGLSLERKDNAKGYSKANCKWASHIEQCNNRRTNVFVTHDGKSQTIQMWARETGINHRTIGERLRGGWPIHEALSTPASKGNKKKRHYETN